MTQDELARMERELASALWALNAVRSASWDRIDCVDRERLERVAITLNQSAKAIRMAIGVRAEVA